MSGNRRPSLHRRLIVWLVGILCIVWLVAFALVLWLALGEVEEANRGKTAHFATAVATALSDDASFPVEVEDDDGFMRSGADNYFVIVRKDGREVHRSANAPTVEVPLAKTGQMVDDDGTVWTTSTRISGDETASVTVGLSERQKQIDALGATLGMVVPMLVGFAAIIGATIFAVSRGLQPLTQLSVDILARSPRQLKPLPDEDTPSELQPIVHSLNGLFSRLDDAMEKERRFIADASHELRTPLAAIKAQLQTIEPQGANLELTATLDKVNLGVDRATRLVEQLLSLARSEAGATDRSVTTVDLADVARRELEDGFFHAIRAGVEVEFSGVSAPFSGNETEIAVLVRNLVDNAVRHAGQGARVVVSTGISDAVSWIEVDDSGPGISEAELEDAFLRFRRGARTRGSGSGLGLAIVKSIADTYRGRVELSRSSRLGGLLVRIEFPLKAALR